MVKNVSKYLNIMAKYGNMYTRKLFFKKRKDDKMRTTIFKPILSDRNFYYSIISKITNQLEANNIQLPVDTQAVEYIEDLIPSIVWKFFYEYRPNNGIQYIVAAWALEYGDLLINEKSDCDLEEFRDRFLISKGYEAAKRTEYRFS